MDIIKIMKVEYEGLWKNDKKDGQGKYTFKNGDLYIREFKADMFSGQVRNKVFSKKIKTTLFKGKVDCIFFYIYNSF